MQVTVDVKGETTHEVDLPEPTYADVLRAVESSEVTVLRLIKGG